MSINFYRQYKLSQRHKTSATGKDALRALVPAAVVLAACGIATLFINARSSALEAERQALADYVNDGANQVEYDECVSLKNENDDLKSKIDADSYLERSIASYPRANTAIKEKIRAYSAQNGVDITFDNYTASSGALGFTAASEDADSVWSFIKTLVSSGLFADVKYAGYQYSDRSGKYQVNVSCMLSEEAGK